jgi:hypothetical protein
MLWQPCGKVFRSREMLSHRCGKVSKSQKMLLHSCGKVSNGLEMLLHPCGKVSRGLEMLLHPCSGSSVEKKTVLHHCGKVSRSLEILLQGCGDPLGGKTELFCGLPLPAKPGFYVTQGVGYRSILFCLVMPMAAGEASIPTGSSKQRAPGCRPKRLHWCRCLLRRHDKTGVNAVCRAGFGLRETSPLILLSACPEVLRAISSDRSVRGRGAGDEAKKTSPKAGCYFL